MIENISTEKIHIYIDKNATINNILNKLNINTFDSIKIDKFWEMMSKSDRQDSLEKLAKFYNIELVYIAQDSKKDKNPQLDANLTLAEIMKILDNWPEIHRKQFAKFISQKYHKSSHHIKLFAKEIWASIIYDDK